MHIVYRNAVEQNDIIWEIAVQTNVDSVRGQESGVWRLPSFLPLTHSLQASSRAPRAKG